MAVLLPVAVLVPVRRVAQGAQALTLGDRSARVPEDGGGEIAVLGRSFNTMAETLAALPLTDAKDRLVEWFERLAIERALAKSGGNISAAARQLGMHRQSLQQKMDQLGMARK